MIRATDAGLWEYAFVPSIDFEITAFQGEKRIWFKPVTDGMTNNMIGRKPYVSYPYMSFHLTPDREFQIHPNLKLKE